MDLLLVLLVAYSLWRTRRNKPARRPLPPGPTPIPIIGNVLDVNRAEPWKSYTNWARIYGSLIYSRLLNQEVIILNSEEVVKDLLERRSHNYSDRPRIVCMTNDFFGWSFNSVMIPYGNRWRLHRRLFHQAFRHEASQHYNDIQLQKSHDLVSNLLETPEHYYAHVQTYSTSIIMSIVYGYETARQNDRIVQVVDRAVKLATASIRPEVAAFLGFFPFLRYIPPWFPGASFKRTAMLSQKFADDTMEAPFRFVQESRAAGTAVPCMVNDSLNRVGGQDTAEEYTRGVKESSATAFAGWSFNDVYIFLCLDVDFRPPAASETTYSTLLVFILAMVLNPDIQSRAQAELDSIVGTERLPAFEDRPSLPYIEAVLRETLRWHPVSPLGVPHATTTADIYSGYFIPQGVTVIMNIWAMTRNEAKYPDPERFQPERFFDADEQLNEDDVRYAFGAGRRICVGRYIADASLWSAIVAILTAFKITPCKDEKGKEVPVDPRWTGGIISRPLDFPCQFVPRISSLMMDKLTQIN